MLRAMMSGFLAAVVCIGTGHAAKPNQAPTVSIASPANGATFAVGATVTFSAVAADADGTVTKVEYLSGGSTLLGVATNAPYTLPVVFNVAGSYVITARATDNAGANRTSSSISIVIAQPANRPPVVAITAPVSGAAYSAPATVSIAASASDPDGSIARVDFYQGSALLGSAATPPYQISWSNVMAGSYSLTAKAIDNAGSTTTSAPVAIAVGTSNVSPLVVLVAPDPCVVYDAPASLVLMADAVDPDGAIARVEFLRGSTIVGTATTAPYGATWTNVPAGSYTLAARAIDQRGASTMSAPVNVVVRTANSPPSVILTSPLDGAVFNAPPSIPVAASAADADGSVAKVEFLADGTLLGAVTAAPYQVTWNNPPAGAHQLVARATDAAGAVGVSAVARVTVNGPPNVQITSPAAGAEFVAPATVPVVVTASASAGPVTKLDFYDGGALIGTIASNATPVTATFNYTNVQPGSHSITVKATDSAGLTSISVARPITVNATPIVTLTSPTGGTQFAAPASIQLAADASVAFGEIAKVEFFAGTALVAAATTSPYRGTWTNVPVGTYALTARATSSAGVGTTSAAVSVTVNSVNLTVDSPADSSTLYRDDVVVSGSFGDGVTVTQVSMNGVAARLGSRTFAAVVPLQIGSNVVTVNASTPSGVVVRTLNVTREQPSVTITNVVDGETIRDDTVTLVGSAKLPPNSAIGIGGQIATVDTQGTFFVNNFPLATGSNAIPIQVNTPEASSSPSSLGAARVARKSAPDVVLNLNRDGIAPFTLELGNATGFAPLTVSVVLKNRLAYAYDDLLLDIDGDGRADYAERGLPLPIPEREFQVTYVAPGVYPLTLTLTRLGSEVVYRAVRMVHVQSVNEAADSMRRVYDQMLRRLAAGDLAGAGQRFTNTVRQRYASAFAQLGSTLPNFVEDNSNVDEATLGEDFAELRVSRPDGNGFERFRILMVRDGDGLWRIDGM